MNYQVEDFTYGVELEYGNCDRKQKLPDDAQWNFKDNSCVSSTGIANDPKGELYQFGGEINTRPTDTIKEQLDHIKMIHNEVDSIINYRSNLHIHIRVPGLKDDLISCKELLNYIISYQQEAFNFTETIDYPSREGKTEDEFQAELKRMKRNFKSHQYKLAEQRVIDMMDSKTTKEFFENHAPMTTKGRMWFFSPRAGINLRQMWDGTDTIEFRHFAGTKDLKEIESALRWCQEFLNLGLNNSLVSPMMLCNKFKWQFPKFQPFEYETEMLYQYTNFDKNSRAVVKERLSQLREKIDIDDLNISSKEILKKVEF